MIGSVGKIELLLILLIVLIVFGVGKLPEIGGALGVAIRDLRMAQREVEATIDEFEKDMEQVAAIKE